MRFRDQMFWSFIIQGGGALSLLLAISILARYLGPVPQGIFSASKVEIEFIGSMVMLGLPQSIFYYIHSSKISIFRAKKLAGFFGFSAGVIALIYSNYLIRWSFLDSMLFASATLSFVWFTCLRSVILSISTSKTFNFITALPQFLVLVYAIYAVKVGFVDNFNSSLCLVLCYATAVIVSLRIIFIFTSDKSKILNLYREEPFLNIIHFGVASGIVAICSNASILISIHGVRNSLGSSNLGIFLFGCSLTQGLLIPINYAVPLLLKRWMNKFDARMILWVGTIAFFMIFMISMLLYLLQHFLTLDKFLRSYSPMLDFLWILVLVASIDAFEKIISVATNAKGAPWFLASSEIVRLVIVGLGVFYLPIKQTSDVVWIIFTASIISISIKATLFNKLSSKHYG